MLHQRAQAGASEARRFPVRVIVTPLRDRDSLDQIPEDQFSDGRIERKGREPFYLRTLVPCLACLDPLQNLEMERREITVLAIDGGRTTAIRNRAAAICNRVEQRAHELE